MANPADIERARQGKDVWNAWAEENPGAEVDFSGEQQLVGIDFAGFVFPGRAYFESAKFGSPVNFHGAEFHGDAWFMNAHFNAVDFGNATFITRAMFERAQFWGSNVFLQATFRGRADFNSASFKGHDSSISFDHAEFHDYANFEHTKFHFGASFRHAGFRDLATFGNAQFDRTTTFAESAFKTVPTFHGTQLHEDTTFESVTWPKRPHDHQSPYDAARAWARLRVEMNRLHKHEDELSFFAMELNARAHDRQNEPRAKRMLYWTYLALGAGRRVATPVRWLLGLNMFLFFPINWYATTAIQWRKLSIWDVLPDVVSFTFGQALPLIGGSNPERVDLYRRLFARADSAGIDIPLWLEVVGIFQQLVGVVLLFMIGLALRNRFRMK